MEAVCRHAAAFGETVPVFGATDEPGQYAVLIKWHPGYMSAPHSYVTDRLCFVLSGTWWVNSGEHFDPEATVRVPAGGFVRRVAHTPHYDGVKKGEKEPAVIGIIGIAPIDLKLVDPRSPRGARCDPIRRTAPAQCNGAGEGAQAASPPHFTQRTPTQSVGYGVCAVEGACGD